MTEVFLLVFPVFFLELSDFLWLCGYQPLPVSPVSCFRCFFMSSLDEKIPCWVVATQIFFKKFTASWEEFPIFTTICFFDGLVQPPTSMVFFTDMLNMGL